MQKHLNELVGVADHRRQIGLRREIDLNVVAAQRVLLQLQSALDNGVDIERLAQRRGGARKFQEILHDARGAASLAMRQIELALGIFVAVVGVAQKFGDAKNRGQRIIELVRDSREHLAHGSKFFGLNELLFEALEFGDVASRNNDAFDFAGLAEERTEVAAEAAPLAGFVANAYFE